MNRFFIAMLFAAPFALCAQGDSVRAPSAAAPMVMPMGGVLGVSMDRMASGTAWIPEIAPLPSRDMTAGGWDVRMHGFAFGLYDAQGGPRGGSKAGSLSWGMLMASRSMLGGMLQLRSMLSLDAAGVGSKGYPLLLQTGESFRGAPLVDIQHPHDFWMELALLFDRPVTSDVAVELYVAPSGEPALGPVAFMHRPSAMDDPAAPIAHHWQDATHVSFGVVTVGLFSRRWKVEGSVFNGREPDENRWNFDLNTLESYSGRVTVSPDDHWSVTGGFGFMREPAVGDPGRSMHRVAASLQYATRLPNDGQWATSLVWSANAHSEMAGLSHSALLESEAVLGARNTVFGRIEFVQKSPEDLGAAAVPSGDPLANLGNASLGYVREVTTIRGATLGIGARAAVSFVPSILATEYGSRTPVGVFLFVRVRPLVRPPMAAMDSAP